MKEFVVSNSGDRIDNYLSNITELSRTKIAKMIKEKKILVNDKEMLTKLQENLHNTVKDRYSLDTVCKERVEVYRQLINR